MTLTLDKETVLFALAIYGAALSSWNLVAALRKERRTVKVTMKTHIPVNMGSEYDSMTFASVEVTNSGYRPVSITTMGFRLPNGKWLSPALMRRHRLFQDTELPVTLTDGQSARVHYAYRDVGEALLGEYGGKKLRIIPFATDALGNSFSGTAWKIDPEEASRM